MAVLSLPMVLGFRPLISIETYSDSFNAMRKYLITKEN